MVNTMTEKTNKNSRARWAILFAVITCLAFGMVGAARAAEDTGAPLTEYQFRFSICEKPELLDYPDSSMVAHMAAWDSPNGLMMARNKPYIELENTSPTADLESFTMSIGDPDYFFDFVRSIESVGDIGVTATLLSPDGVDDGVGGGMIHLEFENFAPGAVVRFQTQLQPYSSDVFQFPDFRAVLFDLNGDNSEDNSLLSATFAEEGGDPVVVEQYLEDYAMFAPTIVGFGYRPYGSMDHVEIFHSQAGFSAVPEPNVAMLCGLALICLASRRFGRDWFGRRNPPAAGAF